MSMSIPLSQLESAASLPFEQIGDTHAGTITAMNERPQTDPNTGQVKTFTDGTPRMVWVIAIEKQGGDTGSLWARGGRFVAKTGSGESMLNAIGTAVRAAGAASVDVGGQLAVRLTGFTEAKPGQNPAKLYTAQYTPPAPQNASVPVDLFSQP
jgi:hypothetical protein